MDKRRILIVDDSPSLTDMWRMLFARSGKFDIGIENDGAAALGTARIFQPHLIFLDVCLGGISGQQVADELKTDPALGDTPVVFLTGLSSAEMSGDPSAQEHMVLSKPVAWEDILAIAEQLLREPAPVVREAEFDSPAVERPDSHSLAA